jgi:hypothetical protein
MIGIHELVERVEKRRQEDNAKDVEQAAVLEAAIEQERRDRNNQIVMKNLDRHFELRGGCYGGEYEG